MEITLIEVTPEMIGRFVDSVPGAVTASGRVRTTKDLVARALDEMVELALAAGLSPGEIHCAVGDSLHNQALKASRKQGMTVFPSELTQHPCPVEMASELAGTMSVLKDFAYVGRIDLPLAETVHWNTLHARPRAAFYADARGTIRLSKPHIERRRP